MMRHGELVVEKNANDPILYYVDGTKKGQRKFKRFLRRKGLEKSVASKIAHQVYVNASQLDFTESIWNGTIHVNFVYGFNHYSQYV